MKFAFGLVSLLVVLGIIAVMMSTGTDYNSAVIKKGNETRETAAQISGVGFNESFSAKAVERGGKLYGLEIVAVRPGGPMDSIFGLRAGDVITGIGPQDVRDINDEEMARALLMDVSRGAGQLEISRNGEKMQVKPAGGFGGGGVGGIPVPVQSH